MAKIFNRDPDDFASVEPPENFSKLLQVLVDANIYIEINMKAYWESPTLPNPDEKNLTIWFLKQYIRTGGRCFSIGSDSHYTAHIKTGCHAGNALSLLGRLCNDDFKIIFDD